jgi:hypothetical protein
VLENKQANELGMWLHGRVLPYPAGGLWFHPRHHQKQKRNLNIIGKKTQVKNSGKTNMNANP